MKKKLFDYSLCLFAFSLSFNPHWSGKALIVMSFFALFNFKPNVNFLKTPFAVTLYCLSFYVLLHVCIGGLERDFRFFSLMGMLLLQLLILSNTTIHNGLFKRTLLFFAIGVYAVGTINLSAWVVKVFEGYTGLYNTWMELSIIDIQKIYFSLYLNLAYFFILYFLTKIRHKRFFVFVLPFILFTIVLLVYSGSMGGIVVFLLLNSLFLTRSLRTGLRKAYIISLTTLPILILILLSVKNVQTVFSRIDGENSRIRNYNVNREIWADSPIWGHGIGKERETMQLYRNSKSWEFKNNYHAHNQYFEFLIGGGLLMLFFYFGLFFTMIKKAVFENIDLLPVAFFISIAYISLLESILLRHHGIVLFSFFLCFFTFFQNRNQLLNK